MRQHVMLLQICICRVRFFLVKDGPGITGYIFIQGLHESVLQECPEARANCQRCINDATSPNKNKQLL